MISIVIPVLNEEKLLKSCLRSLRDQNYSGQYEIIVVDNGCTDRSMEIAQSFGVRIVPCHEKKSVFYARQVGADAAKGEIIVQADADTMYPPGWLQRIADKFAANPGMVALTGRFIYTAPPRWARLEYGFRHVMNRLTEVFLRRPLFVSGATYAFRRREFMAMDGYRGISYFPDQYGITGRLRKIGRVRYDSRLCVKTSPRTVDKPFGRVLLEGCRHLIIWCGFLGSSLVQSIQEFSNRSPSRRLLTRLSLPAVGIAFIAVYGYFIPVSPVFGKVYFKAADSSQNLVALTFDDGPNDPYTTQVLEILREHDVKATFFLVGMNVQGNPDTSRRILAEGHVIGNHSYSHNANHALTDFGAKDMTLAQSVIAAVLGVRPHLYRPPHGKKTPWEIREVQKAGLIEVTWSNSTHELAGWSADDIAHDIINKAKPGGIILLHDGYGTSHNISTADKGVTVKALPRIIEELQEKDYRFVTVPELLKVSAYNN